MYIKLIFRYTSKVAFTYYIITDGEGVSKMVMHDYGGRVGEVSAYWRAGRLKRC